MKFSKFLKHVSSLALVTVLVLSFAIPSFAKSAGTNTATTINLMADTSMRYSLGVRQTNGEYQDNTLLKMFEDEYGITVNVTYDSSGNLVNQMKNDSTHSADVFISADIQRMDDAVNAEIIYDNPNDPDDPDNVYNLLNNQLVLVTKTNGGITNLTYAGVLAWLAADSDRTIAIGDPAVVPAGTYTKKVYDTIDPTGATWNNVLAQATLYSNVTNVLTAVVNGDDPIGSVYATDAKTQGSLLTVLDSKDVSIIYPIGITTAAMNNVDRASASELLVDFFKADLDKPIHPGDIFVPGDSVFKFFGFSPAQQQQQ